MPQSLIGFYAFSRKFHKQLDRRCRDSRGPFRGSPNIYMKYRKFRHKSGPVPLAHSWDHIWWICADCGPVEVNYQGLKDPEILEARHRSQRF